ncbi:MAG TPA: 5'-methylthioadenosine/adenosylhomocysteine nucleosidase [Saprospiraceae bacterium]|nr:5'-methylthioadenosine/adenosylhomocysteine nucleosidase [Saprospiraceae bacterium]HPI05005.1 5'-methylthioadenosine/adenosylhomocysteine nucleosidase [Saprospiraceae bacterium]
MIGIMGAMPEEIHHLTHHLKQRSVRDSGMRTYYQGKLSGIPTVIVFSRWGKVAAAATATNLILEYGVREIIFTGVAGALHSDLNIGDVVVGKNLYQHDMDATPLMPRYEIPLLGKQFFETPPARTEAALEAAGRFFKNIKHYVSEAELAKFDIRAPKVVAGDIASGDTFVSAHAHKEHITSGLPGVYCVEMEGAAVAQVCYEFGIPCTIIRTISDAANESAEVDFPRFIETVASRYSEGIIRELYKKI